MVLSFKQLLWNSVTQFWKWKFCWNLLRTVCKCVCVCVRVFFFNMFFCFVFIIIISGINLPQKSCFEICDNVCHVPLKLLWYSMADHASRKLWSYICIKLVFQWGKL
jgi:hypothetical protein